MEPTQHSAEATWHSCQIGKTMGIYECNWQNVRCTQGQPIRPVSENCWKVGQDGCFPTTWQPGSLLCVCLLCMWLCACKGFVCVMRLSVCNAASRWNHPLAVGLWLYRERTSWLRSWLLHCRSAAVITLRWVWAQGQMLPVCLFCDKNELLNHILFLPQTRIAVADQNLNQS